MIKFLLIRTGLENPKVYEGISPTLGLLYIVSALREWCDYEFEFRLVDMRLDKVDSVYLSRKMINFSPDLIGISSMTTEAENMHRVAKELKGIAKDIPIIVGGPHASTYPQDVIADKNIDYAVIGEGEKTICELIDRIVNNKDVDDVKGIAYRNAGKFTLNAPREFIEDLDQIPFPAWDLLDMEAYWKVNQLLIPFFVKNKRVMDMFTSRACPYNCAYCHRIFGKGFRPRSAENVFLEMQTLYSEYGIREFFIRDDIFNLNKERAVNICDMIIDSNMDIKISFPGGLRGDRMDRELIDKLRQAGTWRICYAVETASPRLQKLIGKNLHLEKLEEAVTYSVKKGFLVHGLFMLGFPTETIEEIKTTIDYALGSKFHVISFFEVVPFPGTALFEMAKEENPEWAKKQDFKNFNFFAETSFYQETTGVDLHRIRKQAKRRSYSVKRLFDIFTRIPFINLFQGPFYWIYRKSNSIKLIINNLFITTKGYDKTLLD